MTLITGNIKDSGNTAVVNAVLVVTLDSPMVYPLAAADNSLLPIPEEYVIPSTGVININLQESETNAVSYHFELFTQVNETLYYFNDGSQYVGPTHIYSGQPYTGTTHTTESILLSSQVNPKRTLVDDFHAVVPNVASVKYAMLQDTGIANDLLDTSVRRLAQVLTGDPSYAAILRGGPRATGNFDPARFYTKDDLTYYDGSSYVYINSRIAAGNYPLFGVTTEYWAPVAAKGNTGTGTSGNNAAYDATAWLNQLDAPSRNAVRNKFELMASLAQLALKANINSPAFTGSPTVPPPAANDRSTIIAPTQWVGNNFATLVDAALQGNPSILTDPDAANNSGRLASTRWTRSILLPSFEFTGNPTRTTTPAAGSNDGTLANTGFVARDYALKNGSAAANFTTNDLTITGVIYRTNPIRVVATAASTAFTTGTTTKIPFTAVTDSHTIFSNADNSATIAIGGFYEVYVSVYFGLAANNTNNGAVAVYVYLNGASSFLVGQQTFASSTAGQQASFVSTIPNYFGPNTVIDVRLANSSGVNASTGAAGANQARMHIFRFA